MKILHLFADDGVEAEPLSAYGDVYRAGIDPRESEFTHELATVDLMNDVPPWPRDFDLVFAHPNCRPHTNAPSADPGEVQIPRARDLCREWADEYVIENQPGAPLHAPPGGSLVTLTGDMFGLPVEYARSFECSYDVEEPPRTRQPPKHRVENTRPKDYWKSIKGVTGDYRSQQLILSGTPSTYVHHLIRPLLTGYEPRRSERQIPLTVDAEGGSQ